MKKELVEEIYKDDSSISSYYTVVELKAELAKAVSLKENYENFGAANVTIGCNAFVMIADKMIKMSTELLEFKGFRQKTYTAKDLEF